MAHQKKSKLSEGKHKISDWQRKKNGSFLTQNVHIEMIGKKRVSKTKHEPSR